MTQPQPAYVQQQQQQQPPLPPPHQQRSQQQQRPAMRPKSKSGFSFRSHKSQDSFGNTPKVDLHETPRDKASRRLTSKADPRLAMSEAEPSAIASDHSTQLASLRAIQHRDINGLPIADPDRSNPTRSRWERPLDTIRSFEAAIDGNYARKSSRYDTQPDSRRSSYYAGSTMNGMTPRNYQDNGYGGRAQPYRNDSYGNGYGSRPDSYYDNGNNNNYNNNGYFPNRARYPRNAPEPVWSNNAGVYPPNGNAQSNETVTTAAGSGSSGEPLGYSTDPSSDNSSFDRLPPTSKVEYKDGYGNNSPSNGQYNNGGNANGFGYQNSQNYATGGATQGYQAYGYQPQVVAPPPPVKDRVPPRVPIKLGKVASGPTQYEASKPVADKRKSWFAKRFSKS